MSNGTSRAFIKNRRPTKNINATKRGAYYIGVDSQDISIENQRQWFGPSDDLLTSPNEFVERVKNHRALKHPMSVKSHHLIFSLRKVDYEAYKRSGQDYKSIIRQVLDDYGKKHGLKMDWIAHIHESEKSKEHPHCHVIIKAVSDNLGDRGYKRIKFTPEDTKEMRGAFEQELDRHAKYRFMEREDMRSISENFGKSFESAMESLAQEAEKKKREAEMERSKKSRNKGRSR
ncbi:MAG: hypothetical protein Q8934_08900 [Bacillota bacterium]|nr:hypothetical protein [Bacillota bacterium]